MESRAHPAGVLSEELTSQIPSCPNLRRGLFKQGSPECCPAVLMVTSPASIIHLPPSIGEGNGSRGSPSTSQGICCLQHSHGFSLGGNTLGTGGRTAFRVMPHLSLQNVSHPCPMAPSHSLEGSTSLSQPTERRWQHSQLTVTRK